MTERKSPEWEEMYRRAEALLQEKSGASQDLASWDLQRLVHELQVHQVELEMQNEELRRAQQELEGSRARYHDLYDAAPVGYFTLDRQGVIEEANHTGAELLGFSREELQGKPFSLFVSRGGKGRFGEYRQRVLKAGTRQMCELELERKDGTRFKAQLASSPGPGAAGDCSQIRTAVTDLIQRQPAVEAPQRAPEEQERLLEDRTAELARVNGKPPGGIAAHKHTQETEEALRQALEISRQRQAEIAALLKAARAVLESPDFFGIARVIFDSCKELIGVFSGYVALLSRDGLENEVLFLEAGGRPCTVDPSLPMPIRGLREQAYLTGRVVYDNDFANQPQWTRFLPQGHVTLDNVLFAPLVIGGKTLGLLGLANKEGGFTENDVRLAAGFGELAAIALLNHRITEEREGLIQEVQDAAAELESANTELQNQKEELEATAEELRVANEVLQKHGDELGKLSQELEHQRARLEAMLQQMPAGLAIAEAPSGRLVLANRQVEEIFRQPMKQFTSIEELSYFQIFHDDGRPYLPEEYPLARSVLYGEVVIDQDLDFLRGDGTRGTLRASAAPIRDREGKIIAAVVTFYDVTEERQREAKIRKLNEELEQRIAEVSERTVQLEAANQELEAFSYSVSHDLRAPLRAIGGFSRMLLKEHAGLLDAEGHRLLKVIRGNTAIMDGLIDDLLTLSRLGRKELRKRRVNVAQLAQGVFNDLKPATTERDCQLTISQGMPPAYGDLALLKQVLVNLLANAVKFTRSRETALIEMGGWTAGEETIYYVKDNGVGFDDKYVGKLFGVFQRLHRGTEFEGSGVGLAIVQRVIERHGGRVWATAKAGGGATFYFALPRKGD